MRPKWVRAEVGIVLEGHLEARDGKKVLGELHGGDFCGEVSLFHGGIRSASMVGVRDGYVAAIMINELTRLYTKQPDMCLRLVRQFGQATLIKMGGKSDDGEKNDPISWNSTMKECAGPLDAFRKQLAVDGFTDNVKLVNAAGQTMKFEYRMSLSPTDPRKALLIFRLKANAVGPSPMRR